MDYLTPSMLDFLDKVGTLAVLALVALAVITDKLIWHTRYKMSEARAARWEKVALDALTAGAAAGVKAAEVAVEVVSAIPDPQGERDRERSERVDGR